MSCQNKYKFAFLLAWYANFLLAGLCCEFQTCRLESAILVYLVKYCKALDSDLVPWKVALQAINKPPRLIGKAKEESCCCPH